MPSVTENSLSLVRPFGSPWDTLTSQQRYTRCPGAPQPHKPKQRLPKPPPPDTRPAGDGDRTPQPKTEGGFQGRWISPTQLLPVTARVGAACIWAADQKRKERGRRAPPPRLAGARGRPRSPPVTAGAGQRLGGPGPTILPASPPALQAAPGPRCLRRAWRRRRLGEPSKQRERRPGPRLGRRAPGTREPRRPHPPALPPRPPGKGIRGDGPRRARCPGDAHPAEAAVSRFQRGPLPGHLGGAARPAPASGLGGEQPRGAAERDSPRRRSWRCCCSCGARPGFASNSLPRRAAASLFLAPLPLPPPPLPPPLRPRRGARGWPARDGRCLRQAQLRLRRARVQRGGGSGAQGTPAPSLRLPA